MLRSLRSALVAAVAPGLIAAAASAQDPSDGLPRASARQWTVERLTPDQPPYIDGAIAQVRGKGEGRFAILCRRGARKAMMAYLPPAEHRRRMVEERDVLDVVFSFDDGSEVQRRLRPTDPPFWTAAFGPRSRIARLMKSELEVNLNPRDFPDVDSDYTLDRSWVSIEEMFAICRN